MTGRIFSPGKLLLTSEYAVLDGALALAVPTKWGQEFFFEEAEDGETLITWEAYHQDKIWLKVEIDYSRWRILSCNLPEPAQFILKVLKNVGQLSSKFKGHTTYHLKTNLQFPPDFGLGSSSTLMNNLADWAGTDAFELNEMSLGGSGYDVAVAKEKSALLYQILPGARKIETVDFQPKFKDDLIFVHLNQKQDSREGISHYRSQPKSPQLIAALSDITLKVLQADHLENFSHLMESHEQKLSDFLQMETVKEKYFENCPVFIKSLGAWGGDFVMSCRFEGFEDYFSEKGFTAYFSWQDLIN